MNVTTCPDTVSLAKYAIAKNALQILFDVLCKIYNTLLITTYISDISRENMNYEYTLRYRESQEY